MKYKLTAYSLQVLGRKKDRRIRLQAASYKLQAGFTLIETLVAVMLLSVAIVAPMSLATRSLSSAYYARDQITAFYLAQEAIEAVRAIRDGQILQITKSADNSLDIFGPIPKGDQKFIIDARKPYTEADSPPPCGGSCPPLQTDGELYGYGICTDGSCDTYFTRTVQAHFVKKDDGTDNPDEIRVTVTVTWKTGPIQARSFTISENMYRWVEDGSGQI